MSKRPSTIKNSLYSLVAFAWPIAMSFFTAPFIVHTLGTENYGLLALTLSIVGFLAFMDFGVAPALVRYTAKYSAIKDFDGLNKIFSAALVFYLIIGTVGATLLVLFALLWAPDVVKVSAENLQTVRTVFLLAAGGFFINMLLTAFAAIPGSLQRFDITSKVNLTVATTSTALTVAIVATGGGVPIIVALGMLTSLSAIFVYRRINKRLIPELHFIPRTVSKDSFRKILAFGGYATIATLATTILFELDKLILGSMLGTSAVAYYVLPGNLATKIHGAVVAMTTVIFPLSTALFVERNHTELNKLYGRATRLVALFLGVMITPLYIYAYPFLLYWLGPDFAANSTSVMQILLATYSILAFTAIPVFLVFGIGKPVYGAIFAGSSAILNLTLLYLMIPMFGLNGAATAYLIAVIPTALALGIFVERKIISFPSRQFYLRLIPQFLVIIMLGLSLSFVLKAFIGSLIAFILIYAATVALVFGLIWIVGIVPKEDKQMVLGYLQKFLPARQT